MGDVMNSPRDNAARKTSKSQPNGDVVAKSKPRPKYYPTPPIWAQSARTQRAGLTTLARPAGNAQAQLGPSPSIKQEPQTNGNGHPASSADKFTKYILGGSKPQQQITKNVADWIFYNVVNRDDAGDLMRYGVELEIEAKLGEVIDVNTNLRYELPTATECLLREKVRVGFKSSMEPIHHRRLNDYLNEQVKFTHPMNPAAQKENRVELKHSHSKQVDKSYDLPPTTYNILPPSLVHYARHAKLRITYDKATNAVVATIIKGRIADLHICNPQSALDCRISISFEMKYEGDISQIVAAKANTGQPDRDKDRHSYALPHYQVDQTVATKVINGQPVHDIEGGSFEVEIELLTAAIKENGTRAKEGQPNIYVELVEGLLDNYRLLARAAGAPMG
ncbi:CYTH-like domain-containing protein [Bisporella sp. PMI_857]|nr:CYTH-like domain-containing protein [Bisporella sp. PMI_857]